MSKKKSATTDDINPDAYDPDPFFGLLDLYFERNSQVLVKHQIDSFDQFIEEIIPNILQNTENVISEKIGENKIIKYRLSFDDLGMKPPLLDNDEGLMFPLDAIQKNLSYMSIYTATVTQWQDITDIETGEVTTKIIGNPEKDVPIAKIPIMVKSKACNLTLKPDLARKHCKYDTGGYFIINGSEKVVSSIEEAILRKILVFTKKEQNVLTYYVQVRSRPYTQFVGNTQIFTIRMKKDGSIMLAIPHFKEISIFVMMRALGLETDSDIVNSILDVKQNKGLLNKLSIAMNMQNNPTISREEAIELLITTMKSAKIYSDTNPEIRAQQRKAHLIKILSQFILPHVVSDTNDPEMDMLYKAFYIGKMINKLLKCTVNDNKEVEEHRGCDDRDSMINKRIELPGLLLGGLFEQYFKKMLNDYAKIFRSKNNVDDPKPPNIIPHIKPNTIEQGLRQALSTGTFGTRKGLAQMLSRLNYLHALSFLRKVITPTIDTSTNKLTSPRHLHMTQYGNMCPLETPEGHKVGIIKNFAMTVNVTLTLVSQETIIKKFLVGKYLRMENVPSAKRHQYTVINFNGNPIGLTDNVIKIHNGLRDLRFRGEIDKTVGLVLGFETREYNIYTEGGRITRPFLTVTRDNVLNFKPEMLENVNSWDEFMIKYPNVIEFLDVEEAQNMMLATFPHFIKLNRDLMVKPPLKSADEINYINKTNRYDDNVFVRYTHCEIHPSMILGVISSNMIFPDHNPGTRGHYHYNQAKQAMGIYRSDYRERIDISYILYHSQIPIVSSRATKYTGANIFPAGENVIVAIMSYMGYNQEDSMLMDKSAVQKGMFRAQSLSKSGGTVKKNPASAQTEQFMKPTREKVDGLKDANYDKLTEEGYVKVETVIEDNDIIIGMVIPIAITQDNIDEKPYKDNSIAFKALVPAVIDKVIIGVNNDNYPIIKIRIRSERIPNIGDKFACYDDQTEVLTDRGWIFFRDLTKEHRVATLVDGNTLAYEHPSDIQVYDYDGKMYLVQSQQVNLCVTPNHKMWVAPHCEQRKPIKKYELVEASKILNEKMIYQKSVMKMRPLNYDVTGKKIPYLIGDGFEMRDGYFILPALDDLPELKFDLESWCFLFGIWIAEGYWKNKWAISISAHKLRVKKVLEPIIEKYGFRVSRFNTPSDKNNERNQWYINNKQLAAYFKKYSVGAVNKYLPEWAWCLNMKYTRHLIHGMMLGDGCWGNKDSHESGKTGWLESGSMRYDTSSVKLSNDFQTLCLHAGFAGNIKKKNEAGYTKVIREKDVTTTKIAWRVSIITTQCHPLVNKAQPKEKTPEPKTNKISSGSKTSKPKQTKKSTGSKSGTKSSDSKTSNTKSSGSKTSNTKSSGSKTSKPKQTEKSTSSKTGKTNSSGSKTSKPKQTEKSTSSKTGSAKSSGSKTNKSEPKNEAKVRKATLERDENGNVDKMIDYKGKVYCCTVNSNIIYVKRNKLPVFCGNSKHGQKGTIGYLPHRADLPFTSSGLKPDIIINPNCIGRRMTIGQLIECLLSKLCAIKGIYGDATPFTGIDLHAINNELVSLGYDAWGNETTYNGLTGQKMNTKIFIGPTFYQRLKQMVCDKAHCLSTDHEVLTLNGWKFVHQLTMDDKVATLIDGKLVYQNPTKILNYPNYKGDMYHIETQQVDLLVTPNHRMYVSKLNEDYDFELAEDIVGECRRYKTNAIWGADNYQIALSSFDISGDCLPDWALCLSAPQARTLLDRIVSGNETYHTSSTKLADDIMQLALHCGWSCNTSLESDMLKLTINKSNNNPIVNHQTEIIEDYDKPVFCLQVPGGVFYVRRNGKPVWTGNSRARGPKQMLTRQPTEGKVRSGGLRFGEMERDVMIAHGSMQMLKERTVDNSDICTAYICDLCGLFASKKKGQKFYECHSCENTTKISKIVIPYPFMLFMNELRTMGVMGRIRTSKSIVTPRGN